MTRHDPLVRVHHMLEHAREAASPPTIADRVRAKRFVQRTGAPVVVAHWPERAPKGLDWALPISYNE